MNKQYMITYNDILNKGYLPSLATEYMTSSYSDRAFAEERAKKLNIKYETEGYSVVRIVDSISSYLAL
jgi:hypothetical protein